MDPVESQSTQTPEEQREPAADPFDSGNPVGLDDIFGVPDSPGESGIRSSRGQADPADRGGAEGDQAGEDESDSEHSDDDGLEEVKLASGKSVRVTPEIAKVIRQQQEDYKHLQAEFTRTRQGKGDGEGQDPDQPKVTEAQRKEQQKRRAELIAQYDQQLFEAIDNNDGKGATETIIKVADARARAVADAAIAEFIESHFAPFQQLVNSSLGESMFESVATQAITEAAAEAELDLSDEQKQLVKVELRKIAKAKGESPNRDHLNLALIRVASGKVKPSRGRQAEETEDEAEEPPLNPAALRRPAPYSGAGSPPSRSTKPSAGRQSRAVHRADPLAAL